MQRTNTWKHIIHLLLLTRLKIISSLNYIKRLSFKLFNKWKREIMNDAINEYRQRKNSQKYYSNESLISR